MKSRAPLTSMALLAVATIGGCRGGCCDVIINGHPPPNAFPRASHVEFPDPTLTAGRSLTVSGVESLFQDDDPLTLTADILRHDGRGGVHGSLSLSLGGVTIQRMPVARSA